MRLSEKIVESIRRVREVVQGPDGSRSFRPVSRPQIVKTLASDFGQTHQPSIKRGLQQVEASGLISKVKSSFIVVADEVPAGRKADHVQVGDLDEEPPFIPHSFAQHGPRPYFKASTSNGSICVPVSEQLWSEWFEDPDCEGAEYGAGWHDRDTVCQYDDGCWMHDNFGGGYYGDGHGDELQDCMECPDCYLAIKMREHLKQHIAKSKSKRPAKRSSGDEELTEPVGELGQLSRKALQNRAKQYDIPGNLPSAQIVERIESVTMRQLAPSHSVLRADASPPRPKKRKRTTKPKSITPRGSTNASKTTKADVWELVQQGPSGGSGGSAVLQLRNDRIHTVGREEDADLHLPAVWISRKHCSVRVVADGVELIPLATDPNAVRVNGGKTTKSAPVVVRAGDTVRFGKSEIFTLNCIVDIVSSDDEDEKSNVSDDLPPDSDESEDDARSMHDESEDDSDLSSDNSDRDNNDSDNSDCWR